MKIILQCIIILATSWFFTTVWAEPTSVEVIRLQHRSGQELVPIIRPMLPAGSIVTGNGYSLVVKTSPQGLWQVHNALKTLDQVPKMLLITVRQGGEQLVKVLDGQVTFIQTQRARYYQNRAVGFYVTPRLSGNQVMLTINPQSESLGGNGNIAFQQAKTITAVPLGVWADLGSSTLSESQSQQVIAFGKAVQPQNTGSVFIKVDLVDQ